jgi:hypothetical protein
LGKIGKECSLQFEFAHDDLKRNAKNLVELNRRMQLTACFQQRLQPNHLLLRQKGFTYLHQKVSTELLARCVEEYMLVAGTLDSTRLSGNLVS